MRKKTLWTIYIIIGLYLSILNPIFSLLFTEVYTIGFYVPLEPLVYWTEWFWKYGLLTLILAGIGVKLVILGYRDIKSSPQK